MTVRASEIVAFRINKSIPAYTVFVKPSELEDVVNAVRRPNVFVADPVMPEGVGFIVDHEIGGSVDGVYIRRGGFGALRISFIRESPSGYDAYTAISKAARKVVHIYRDALQDIAQFLIN